MQAYPPGFARIYNLRWKTFAQNAAPRIQAYYESTPLGAANRTLLDVCCGTGQLAQYFLDLGYRVTGLDLSAAMLDYARQNNAPYLVEGQAEFLQADAAGFSVPGRFGLAVSTFDALNHLPDLRALSGCFRSVHAALLPGGTFLFDLNTRAGLRRWGAISIEDNEEMTIITRGLYDAAEQRGYTYISGYYRVSQNQYERFEETAYNTGFDLAEVQLSLQAEGFANPRFCRLADLRAPLAEPDAEARVFIVAEKA